jgi:hypothetical protein
MAVRPMSTLTEKPSYRQPPTLSMVYNYAEEPGVKKLHRGYKLLPKGALFGVSGTGIDAGMFILIYSLFAALIVYAFSLTNISLGWVITVMAALGIALISPKLKEATSWVLTDPSSPVAINKARRINLKKARLLARRLGPTVVPVLTAKHVETIYELRTEMLLAAATADQEYEEKESDYDRLAVLLLEDLNREDLLLDLIKSRGIANMDGIEAALKEIEDNTIRPLQSGWL